MGGLSFSSDTSSNLAAKLQRELQTSDHLDASFMAYLQYCGMFPDVMESTREKDILSPQLKVIHDSHKHTSKLKLKQQNQNTNVKYLAGTFTV